MSASVACGAVRMPSASSSPISPRSRSDQLAGVLGVLVDCQAEAKAKLGIVLEQAV